MNYNVNHSASVLAEGRSSLLHNVVVNSGILGVTQIARVLSERSQVQYYEIFK